MAGVAAADVVDHETGESGVAVEGGRHATRAGLGRDGGVGEVGVEVGSTGRGVEDSTEDVVNGADTGREVEEGGGEGGVDLVEDEVVGVTRIDTRSDDGCDGAEMVGGGPTCVDGLDGDGGAGGLEFGGEGGDFGLTELGDGPALRAEVVIFDGVEVDNGDVGEAGEGGLAGEGCAGTAAADDGDGDGADVGGEDGGEAGVVHEMVSG